MANRAQVITEAIPGALPLEQNVLFSPYWTSPLHRSVKRLLDVILSTVLLAITLPIMIVIAIAIKLDSHGPILYRWRVVGAKGKPFRSWKLRSMCVDADHKKEQLAARNEMRGPVFKLQNDPRVTRVGKILRRYSLDELPQFFSVLIGDMSLVGPRPPLQTEYANFSQAQKGKLMVKPGITCLWQVSGRNQIRDFDEWARLDLEYIRTWSLGLDGKILWKTVGAVLRGTGR
jgi:lipopolysaccharide/colanic/teichoic acid biosynthesis glycosyltransferase